MIFCEVILRAAAFKQNHVTNVPYSTHAPLSRHVTQSKKPSVLIIVIIVNNYQSFSPVFSINLKQNSQSGFMCDDAGFQHFFILAPPNILGGVLFDAT